MWTMTRIKAEDTHEIPRVSTILDAWITTSETFDLYVDGCRPFNNISEVRGVINLVL